MFADLEGGGQRRGAGRFRQSFCFFQKVAHGNAHFIVIDQNKIIEQIPDNALGQHKGFPGCQTTGKGVNGCGLACTRLPGQVTGWRAAGLDGNHPDLWVDGFGGDTSTGRATTAPQRHDDHLHIGLGFENF